MTSNPNRLFEGMRNVFLLFFYMVTDYFSFLNWLCGPVCCFTPVSLVYHLLPSLNILSFSSGLGSFPVGFPFWLAPDPLWKVLGATWSWPRSTHGSQPWAWVLSAYRRHLIWHIYPLRQWLSNLFWLWPTVRSKIDIITLYTHKCM